MEEVEKKKGCGCGCFIFVAIISFGLFFIANFVGFDSKPHVPDIIESRINTNSLTLEDSYYTIIQNTLTENIVTAKYSWDFRTSKFKSKSMNLGIEINPKDVDYAMEILKSLEYLTLEDLNITKDWELDPEGYANEYWTGIYQKLAQGTSSQVDSIADNLVLIAQNEKLDQNDLLLFCITFVQNITYQIPEESLGIIPPIASLAREYGDCDTTAMLLYSLLKRIGYDCILYYSREYAHAMLGISTNATGSFKTVNGLKYYFLEVTNPGWGIGQISPEFQDISKWTPITL